MVKMCSRANLNPLRRFTVYVHLDYLQVGFVVREKWIGISEGFYSCVQFFLSSHTNWSIFRISFFFFACAG